MLRFCEPGDEYTVPWINQAFSRCFLEVVGSITCAGLLYVLGMSSVVLGSKPKKNNASSSFLSSTFTAMFVTFLLMATTYGVDLIVKGVLHINGDEIYGYVIVVDVLGMISWIFAIAFLVRENHHILQGHAHGTTLAVFWLTNIIWLSLQLVSFNGQSWWWHLSSHADISDLVLFIIRGVLLTMMVILGIARPLCCPPKSKDYSLLVNAGSEVDVDRSNKDQQRRDGSFVRQRNTSAFSGFIHKVKILFPYVWPKGLFVCLSLSLFLCVCVRC